MWIAAKPDLCLLSDSAVYPIRTYDECGAYPFTPSEGDRCTRVVLVNTYHVARTSDLPTQLFEPLQQHRFRDSLGDQQRVRECGWEISEVHRCEYSVPISYSESRCADPLGRQSHCNTVLVEQLQRTGIHYGGTGRIAAFLLLVHHSYVAAPRKQRNGNGESCRSGTND